MVFGSLRKRVALVGVLVVALTVVPAWAATADPSLALGEADDVVLVVGNHFDAGTVDVVAAVDGGSGKTTATVKNGRFVVAFSVPEAVTGSVGITARQGEHFVQKTLTRSQGAAPSTATAAPTTAPAFPSTGTVLSSAFGATADDTSDDTAALQAAINAAKGKALTIEAGTYRTTGLVLDGPTRVTATGAILEGAGGTAPLLSITQPVAIDGVGLKGNGTHQGGIRLDRMSGGVSLSNCRIDDIDFDPGAITVLDSADVQISKCTITNSGVDAIHLVSSKDITVSNTTITNSKRHGVEWWGGDSAHPTGSATVSGLSFTNNTVSNSGGGGIWGSMGTNITITGNRVDECGDVCIDPEGGKGAVITDNRVKNGKNGGITTFYGALDVKIQNNTIEQSPGYGHGIMIYGTGTSRNLTIMGNAITTSGSNGLYTYDDTLGDSTITGNTVTLKAGGVAIDIHGTNVVNTVSDNTIQ